MVGDNPVRTWFGARYGDLHPLLQQLHNEGGSLSGPVEVKIPRGMAGWIGKRLAHKLGISQTDGARRLSVAIFHDNSSLHWHRCFDSQGQMVSVFTPVGTYPSGYWEETTGPTTLCLTVDIKDGDWYWRLVAARVRGVQVPLWLMPRVKAFKTIQDGRYQFYVGISLPVLGTVLSYSGLLSPATSSEP
jgi:hypothetical protein